MEPNSIGQPAAPTPTPTGVQATEIAKNLGVDQPRRPRLGRLRLTLTVLVAVLILALLGPLGYMFWQLFNGQAEVSQQQNDNTYNITTIPLDDLIKGQDITTAVNQQVNINGRLRINNSFVLTPSDVPADPLLGQFYLNQQNTQLYYYNGVEFVDLATGSQLGQLESQLGQAEALATQLQTQVNSLGSTSIDASNINNGTLGDAYLSPNVALLDRSNQVFVGGSQVFRNSSNSAAAFAVQNAAGQNSLVVDTVSQRVAVGPGATPATSALTVGTNTTSAAGGITLGTDTNLYRSAANTLKTDDNLQVARSGAFGNLAVVENSGADRSTLNVQQSHTDLSGVANMSSVSSLLYVEPQADTAAAIFAIDNQLYAAGDSSYSGPIITNYSYAEKTGSGNAYSLVAAEGDSYNYGTGTIEYGAGAYGYYSDSSDGGTSIRGYGLWGEVYGYGSGNIQNAAGVAVTVRNQGAGVFTNGYGVLVQAAGNTGGGSFLNNYGVYIQDQSGAGSSNSYNLYSAGAASNNLIEGGLRVQGATLLRNSSNSTTAFQVQNASGTPLLTADTTNMTITVQALQVTGNLTVNGHIVTGGSTPSTAVNANAGVGATCVASGTDTAGTITITTGSSGVVAGTQCTVTFATAFGAAPRVVVGPSNAAAAPLDPYVGSTATNNFTVGVGTAGSTSAQYRFDYVAAQ